MKILIAVDLKHRDLASAALIGFFLDKLGYEIHFCSQASLWKEEESIRNLECEVIILPKPIVSSGLIAKCKLQNITTISFNTEGNPQDKEYQYKIPIATDLLITWNKKQKDSHESYFKKYSSTIFGTNPKIINLGCMRLDFHHKKYSFLFKSVKEEMIKKFNIEPKDTVITVATSTQDADLSLESRKIMNIKRKIEMEKSAGYWDLAKSHDLSRQLIIQTLTQISEIPNIKVILKPHPHENVSFWEKTLLEFDKQKFYLLPGGNIQDLLCISNIHIANNVCTTTFEAKLREIPTIELNTAMSSKLFEEVHLEIADHRVFSAQEVKGIIENRISSKEFKTEIDESFKTYIQDKYGKFDGSRCEAYASEIDSFLADRQKIDFSLWEYLNLIFLAYSPVFMLWVLHKPLSKLTLIKRKTLHFLGLSKELDMSAFSEEKGLRFDPIMAEGDEKYWYKKFETNIKF